MDEPHFLTFGPFRFDGARDRLWHEQKVVELRAKPLAVLRYLLEHYGKVTGVRTDGHIDRPLTAPLHADRVLDALYPSRRGLLPSVRALLDFLADGYAGLAREET